MPIVPSPPTVIVKVPTVAVTQGTLPFPPAVTVVPVAGPPGPPGATYVHNQSAPSASWVVVHNLNLVRNPVVVLASDLAEIVYPDVTVVDLNTVNISFDSAVTGKAYL